MNRDSRDDAIERVEDPLKPVSQIGDCDRTVIGEARNLDEHGGLPTHTE
jgi:hypothetical protein